MNLDYRHDESLTFYFWKEGQPLHVLRPEHRLSRSRGRTVTVPLAVQQKEGHMSAEIIKTPSRRILQESEGELCLLLQRHLVRKSLKMQDTQFSTGFFPQPLCQ